MSLWKDIVHRTPSLSTACAREKCVWVCSTLTEREERVCVCVCLLPFFVLSLSLAHTYCQFQGCKGLCVKEGKRKEWHSEENWKTKTSQKIASLACFNCLCMWVSACVRVLCVSVCVSVCVCVCCVAFSLRDYLSE